MPIVTVHGKYQNDHAVAASGEQRPRSVLPGNHQMAEPGREPVAGIVVEHPHFRRRAQGIRDPPCRPFVVGSKSNPDMAVVENRVVGAVGLLDLVEHQADQRLGTADIGRRHEPGRGW